MLGFEHHLMAGPLSHAPLGGNLAMTESNPNQVLSL